MGEETESGSPRPLSETVAPDEAPPLPANRLKSLSHSVDGRFAHLLSSDKERAEPPRRTLTTSAMMETAISAGVLAAMSRPMGA